MLNYNWIKNKNVIITGVSSGIGYELASQLVEKYDCNILGIARNLLKLDRMQKELGENFSYYSMDVGNYDEWKRFAESEKLQKFKPDIIINNAGIIHPFVRFMALADEEIERVIKTNYLSLIYSCKTMVPILSQSNTPSIINIASASALLPVAGASIYSSTKSAAYSFTDVLRQELSARKFYVAVVLPGPVKTNLYKVKNEKGEKAVKVANKKLFENAGITAEKAAKKIIRKIRRKKNYIVVGTTAHGMGIFHNLMPNYSIKITGRMLRVLPFETFRNIFNEEQTKLENK